jgi:hypothetical protein
VAKRPKLTPEVLAVIRALGSIGGKTGGKARWAGVSPEDRTAHARMAAKAKWDKVRTKKAKKRKAL